MSNITTKSVATYVFLPGIIPRLKALFGSGFQMFAYLIAQIYSLVRLLPSSHPYLNPDNIGRFNVLNVISEAANNIEINLKNIDQIIVFSAILAGLIIFGLQVGLLAYSLVFAKAFAQTAGNDAPGLFSLFITPDPTHDVALGMLDRVFGVKDFFCSGAGNCTEVNATLPWPMHDALHALFGFYSYGLLVIGLIIFFYFVVVVIAETATSGTPFGQRFQNVWVPIRLLLAISLLVPINGTLNGAQYVTLYAAKMGSGLGTNAWIAFNRGITNSNYFNGDDTANPAGAAPATMVGRPTTPYINGIIQDMAVIHTCAYMAWRSENPNAGASAIREGSYLKDGPVKAYFAKNPFPGRDDQRNRLLSQNLDGGLREGLTFYDLGDINVIFGIKRSRSEQQSLDIHPTGDIEPKCGIMRIPITSLRRLGDEEEEGGPGLIQKSYFQMIQLLWFGGNGTSGSTANAASAAASHPMYQFAVRQAEVSDLNKTKARERACAVDGPGVDACTDGQNPSAPGQEWIEREIIDQSTAVGDFLSQAHKLYLENTLSDDIKEQIEKYNWGGAGQFYEKIAQFNGVMQTAALSIPERVQYPQIMEDIREVVRSANANVSASEEFSPQLAPENRAEINRIGGLLEGKTLSDAFQMLTGDRNGGEDADQQASLNIFEHAMRLILGADGIFDIRGENSQLHPIAQLSMIGKGMVENTIRNMAISSATGFLGGIMAETGTPGAGVVSAISGFFFATAFTGLTVGITLFYVLPFLPFIYFFFAVATWVKSIFEAMVGAPLWALAHLRIDGEGLPGEAASNGYFLLFEIMIRPLLIVVGLVAGMIIFSAQVRILNFIWDVVVENSAGFRSEGAFNFCNPNENFVCDVQERTGLKRSTMDQFFFTIIYTIVVYLLGNATFKLIDMIPNQILRWAGSGATAFADQNEDIVQGLTQKVAVAGMIQGQQFAQGVNTLSGQAGGAVGQLFSGGRGNPPAGAGRGAAPQRPPPDAGGEGEGG